MIERKLNTGEYLSNIIQEIDGLIEQAKNVQEAIGPLTTETEYYLCELFFMSANVVNNFKQRTDIMKNVYKSE